MVALAVSERLSVAGLRDAARAEPGGKVRARILAMARLREGGERGATAKQFGMSRNVLRIWVGRYNAAGIEGLVDRHGGGAPARLTAEQRDALKQRVLAGADLERDAIVAYRILDIRAPAEREFGVRYSHGGMHRVLHAIGCAWLMPRPHHPKGDAEAARRVLKKLPQMVEDIAREHPGQPIELWFQDEMRVGQKGTLTRVWAAKGTRATAPRDLRFGYAYLFGAVCPARDTGAAIVMPMVNTIAMNEHLVEIGRCVSPGAHAVLILDGAGWHPHQGLAVPANVSLLFLPTYSPQLNPVEELWHELRRHLLANRVIDTVEDLIEACCRAWNAALHKPGFIKSVTGFSWLPPPLTAK